VESGAQKTCNISETVQNYHDGLIESRIRAFDCMATKSKTLDDLNGRNVTLAKQNYGARHKNFIEDRSILSAAKCRPMILVARNIKCMRIFAGFQVQ